MVFIESDEYEVSPRDFKIQGFKLFTPKKKDSVPWNDNTMGLMVVSGAAGGVPDQMLENVDKYAYSSISF